jgi:hypothetical protein
LVSAERGEVKRDSALALVGLGVGIAVSLWVSLEMEIFDFACSDEVA